MTYTAGQKLRASQMPGYVCTSSTRPTGHSGQIIYETDTGMIALYDGAAWRYLAATGAINSDGEYNMATSQSIPNITNTRVELGTTNVSSPLITKTAGGSGHTLTVLRAGRWSISCTFRWGSSAAGGERYHGIQKNAAVVASSGQLKAATAAPLTFNMAVVLRLAVNDVIDFIAYQGSGAAASMEFNNGAGWGRVNLSWIGP